MNLNIERGLLIVGWLFASSGALSRPTKIAMVRTLNPAYDTALYPIAEKASKQGIEVVNLNSNDLENALKSADTLYIFRKIDL